MINCNDNDENVDDEDGSVTVNDLSGSDVTAGWIQPLKTKQKSAAGEQHTLSSSSSS